MMLGGVDKGKETTDLVGRLQGFRPKIGGNCRMRFSGVLTCNPGPSPADPISS